MFAYSQEWNTPNIINQSKVTEDIFVICDAFQAFERHSLVRPSPNTNRDYRILSKQLNHQLDQNPDPTGEEIHIFLSRLWRLAFEAVRNWLRLFNKLDLASAYQKPMAVQALSVLAPLKHYRNIITSLPNLLFTLRLQEELSNNFFKLTHLSWMNWQAGQAGALITSLCDPSQVQVVENWLHSYLSPLLPIEQHIFDEDRFWTRLQQQDQHLLAQQLSWQALFPDTEISIDVYQS